MAGQQDGPRERAARYRELAGEALTSAAQCKDQQAHVAYLKLAETWNAMAAEVEFLLR
jgi:hypothetical protein